METSACEWFENDEFWTELFDLIFNDDQFALAAENVPRIMTLAGVTGGQLLDLACGPGRYAIPFACAGFQVTAVDRTQPLLDEAQRRAGVAGVAVEWIRDDMRSFVRPATFDLAVNLFTSFGYFDDPADDRRVLANLYASLKPGGVLVMELLGKELLAARYQPTRSTDLPDGRILFHRTKVTHGWSRVEDDWTYVQGGKVKRFQLHHWLYSGQELCQLLKSAGFDEAALYGSFRGTPYDAQADRLIAIARKPASGVATGA